MVVRSFSERDRWKKPGPGECAGTRLLTSSSLGSFKPKGLVGDSKKGDRNMRTLFLMLPGLVALAPAASAYCTTSGQPGMVALASHVLEIQDDTAYRAGRDVWVTAGVKADAQLFAWLVWSSRPTGQGCVVTFEGRRNDTCAARVDIQFEQRTAYNVGFSASDVPPGGASTYPYFCSTELMFHIFDSGEFVPNPRYDPADPASPQYIVDPGFDFYSVVGLNVTGEHYVNPGGVGTVPIGVSRNGCPQAQPGDEFPAYMLEGPGCPAATVGRTGSTTTSSSGTSWQATTQLTTQSWGAQAQQFSAARVVRQGQSQPTAATIRAASKAKLDSALARIAENTRTQNGRPVVRKQ